MITFVEMLVFALIFWLICWGARIGWFSLALLLLFVPVLAYAKHKELFYESYRKPRTD